MIRMAFAVLAAGAGFLAVAVWMVHERPPEAVARDAGEAAAAGAGDAAPAGVEEAVRAGVETGAAAVEGAAETLSRASETAKRVADGAKRVARERLGSRALPERTVETGADVADAPDSGARAAPAPAPASRPGIAAGAEAPRRAVAAADPAPEAPAIDGPSDPHVVAEGEEVAVEEVRDPGAQAFAEAALPDEASAEPRAASAPPRAASAPPGPSRDQEAWAELIRRMLSIYARTAATPEER